MWDREGERDTYKGNRMTDFQPYHHAEIGNQFALGQCMKVIS